MDMNHVVYYSVTLSAFLVLIGWYYLFGKNYHQLWFRISFSMLIIFLSVLSFKWIDVWGDYQIWVSIPTVFLVILSSIVVLNNGNNKKSSEELNGKA